MRESDNRREMMRHRSEREVKATKWASPRQDTICILYWVCCRKFLACVLCCAVRETTTTATTTVNSLPLTVVGWTRRPPSPPPLLCRRLQFTFRRPQLAGWRGVEFEKSCPFPMKHLNGTHALLFTLQCTKPKAHAAAVRRATRCCCSLCRSASGRSHALPIAI